MVPEVPLDGDDKIARNQVGWKIRSKFPYICHTLDIQQTNNHSELTTRNIIIIHSAEKKICIKETRTFANRYLRVHKAMVHRAIRIKREENIYGYHIISQDSDIIRLQSGKTCVATSNPLYLRE